MSEILRKFKWILFLLIPLFFETNTANAESHSVWLDSTFTKYQIDVNPYFLQEHLNGLNSVETGDSLDFSYVFSGLNPESRVYVYQMNGDSITSIRVGDSVFFYMPDEDVYLSIKNPVYEIIYDSDYIDYFDGYNNPTAVEAGSIVNIVFKKGIIPGGTQQLWGGWYIFDGITVHDSVASFVMPYGNVKLTAARMTDLEIMDNIQCEGGTLRHSETGNAGDTIFFNACPDKGYYIRTIYVSNSEDFKKLDDTTYSFVMLPNLPVWINVCFEKAPIYHSISVDSTFAKYNITVNPYWLRNSKGLDSILVGEQLDFMYMFRGLNYESTVSVREKNGGLIYKHMMGDSVDFFMPDSNIVLSVENPVYEITYDSAYINHFNGFSYPISAEAGTTVKILYEGDIIARVSRETWNGSWTTMDETTIGWERSNTWSVTFTMPFTNVLVGSAQTKDLPIYKQINCGEGQINCPQEVGNARDTIWFTVHPDAGYTIQSVNVTGGRQFHAWDDTTYMFEMVEDKSATIYACFTPISRSNSIIVDPSCKDYMKEYGSIYLIADGYFDAYEIGTQTTIESVLMGVKVTMAHFKDLRDKSLVRVRTESGKTVEYETMSELDSIWFAMPEENIYISMEKAQTPYYTITVDSSCKDYMKEYGSIYLIAEGYSHGYRINTQSTIDSVLKGVKVTMAHFKDLRDKSLVRVRTESGKTVEYETMSELDSIWFAMPEENIYISMEKAQTPYYTITVDSSCKDYMKEYGSIYLIAEGYSHGYRINTQSTIDSVLKGVKVTLAHFKDLRDKSLVRVRTESGKTVEYETMSELDSIWFAMPEENIYISMEKAQTPYYTITVDSSCKDYMKEYGSIYLIAEGYSHGYRINTQSTIDSVLKGVKVTMAHFKDLRDKSLVRVRTESGKTVEYETISELDSIWFAMPNENIYISMEEDHTPYYTITVDASCKDKMDEYGSVYLTAEGYSHGYRVNTHSTIDSVEKGVRVTLAHFKDLSQKSLVKVRTESGKTVEYETVTEFDSIWFAMPNENIYISMEEAATKVNIDTIVICGKGWISAPTSGNAKDTIWFSVHPAVGYHVQFVEVSGNTPIHLWDDTTYIFKLVAGKDVQITVCFAIDMICGCTDPAALNYDSLATVRDNSCIYPTVIYGCTDPKALNYDPEATHNSGLCEYVKEIGGCTDANALNYDSLATYNDGSCQYPREIIHGCTDTFALNYNPYAEIDNNTCEYRTVSDTIVGCMDAKAINYNPLASVSSECIYEKVDSVIVVEGCTDPKAANYNEKATKEDGSCVYANPISTYNDVAEVIVNDNQEVVVVVDTVKSIGVVETNGCEIDFAEKIDSVSVKVLSYDDDELITNWEVYQAGSVIYYDNVTVTCTEKEFVVLNLSLICNKNMKKPSGLRAKSTKVYAATLRSLVDLRDFGTTTIVLDENVASLYVYPNPASEIIYVEAPSLKDKTLQMVNLNGEVVKVVKANSNKLQITVGDLTAGAYILFSQDGSVSETVIIK